MTNERAIELLHRLQDEQFDGQHGDERREALEMAVRALEQNLVKESGDLVQDLVKDCISRKATMIVIENSGLDDDSKDTVVRVLEQLPSAQPQRKTGKWVSLPGRLGNEVECNQCHDVYWYWMGNYRFCPHCGADMRGESDE